MPPYQNYDAYVKAGGYAVLRSCLSGARKVEDVIAALSDGGLRGLGGAGFPTGRKWGLVRAEKGPRLMAVNGDEGEPGTFKDRIYLESEPHKFLEGMLIAAWAVEAEQVFIYMRDEYPAVLKILKAEIPKLEAAGLAKHTKVHVRRGAGAYICGEESAMIESIEGKRGLSAPSPALCGPGRHLRPADARQQHRDALLGACASWRRARRGSRARARTAPRACAPTRCRAASRSRASC